MRLATGFLTLKIAQAVFLRDRLTHQVLLLMLALVCVGWQAADATDVKQVPLWDGETSAATPDGLLINRYGGPPVPKGDTKITVNHVTNVVHAGHGAYRADITGPVSDFAFFQLALSGFGPTAAYVMSRDILRFDSLCFWLKNDTGVSFTLKVELKDYRGSSSHLQFRRYPVSASSTWGQFCAPLTDTTDWTVVGTPDLRQARFIGFVFETTPALPLNGAVYFDDMVLIEPGIPMDPATAPLSSLVLQVVRRQFDGLWGSRNRTHGMIPLNSLYADVAALNATSAVVKLLPVAYQQGWVTQAEADAYIMTLVTTLHTLMDHATYLPPRYVDWVTLAPNDVREESPVDAAFLALALYQYRALPSTPPGLQTQIGGLLGRFNFAAFGSPQGWKLAYSYGPPVGFTAGSYDGYSGEIWIMSLAAHLMPTNRVEITQYYHTGINRVQAFCEEPNLAHVVHSDTRFRAPFLQWLFPLFVKLYTLPEVFPVDNYPVAALATNPLQNAVRYQRDVHRWFAHRGRALLLQPDAGDNGNGHYEQYSCYNNFGEPDLFMPWSAAFSLLAELTYAEPALRSHLAHGLHGPLGLSDSVHWVTNAPEPAQITVGHDFWNVSLSTMAMISFLFQDNEFLSSLPAVRAALEQVFPPIGAYIVAAVLPSSRSVQVGTPATAFATIINTGPATAVGCSPAPPPNMPATFTFQTTNPTTNQLAGTPDTPVDIAVGAAQSFVFAFTPTASLAPTEVQLTFDCTNTAPAPSTVGLNTLLLTAASTPVPDIVALAATLMNDGVVHIPGPAGIGIFAVATVNVGASGAITATADTGGASLPVSLSLCETGPATGKCVNPQEQTTSPVMITINANATPTFGVFVTGSGAVPFDPATNRIFVRFKDASGVTRGSTSVAVRTQ